MDLEQLIIGRRTVHNYLPGKIPDEVVVEALRLSLWAPNHKLSYPWVYTWIGPAARSAMADLSVEIKAAKEGGKLSDVKERAVRESVINPSHLISLGIKRSESAGRQHEDYATLACSVQIASMFLWANGVSSKWTTGAWSAHEKTYGILGLDPGEVKLEGALMIGQPQVVPEAPERPPLDKFLRRAD